MTQRSDHGSQPKGVAELCQRLRCGAATVAVVGLGYVGLPTVRAFFEAGFRVVGFDIDEEKIRQLKAGKAYLKHLGDAWISELSRSDRFEATTDPARLKDADAVVLCVPTPLGKHREPDLRYVQRSTEMVAGVLRPGQLVVLTSTSYPGTTREICKPILDSTGLECGRAYFLAFSPEREDPGRPNVQTRQIPRLVGGVDPESTKVAEALLSAAIERVVVVETAEIAEAAKLLENIYRAVNIALVNELKPVLAEMGIDIWRVIEAAATKPFGFQAFHPGPGLGGHCIPIDPFYLTWRAREFGRETRFIELAGEINSSMPAYVVERTAGALNDEGKALRGSEILVIGLAYKPDIDDVRETPAAEIIERLMDAGARVSYHDPHVPRFPAMRKYRIDLTSTPLHESTVRRADCIVIVTNHVSIDWALIGRTARLIVDTRDAMGAVSDVAARVIKA